MPHQLHQNTRFLDKSFNEQNTRDYVMSAMLDMHGFVLSVYDSAKNKIIGLVEEHFEELENEAEINTQLDILLNKIPWLGFPFLQASLVYRTPVSTLVPLPLFDKNNAALYLEFNHAFPKENRILFENVKHNDAVNIYSLPNAVVEKVKISWPNVLLKHVSSCLIEQLHVLVKNKSDNNSLFVNVAENSFDLVYFKHSKLHFINQFAFHTKEDFIYFLLTAIEQLQLNPESVELMLSGKIDKSDALYEIIYRYIRKVSFLGRNDNFSYSYVLDEVKPHKHFILFNSLQCE